METYDRRIAGNSLSTESAFYLAMQSVFRAGMKRSTFKVTFIQYR